MSATWFITGASRGIGWEVARQALERGDNVVATARDPAAIGESLAEHADRLLALALDVTDDAQAKAAARLALERFGSIDVLVNNAGRGLLGAVEEASADEVRAVFETNVFGTLTVIRAVLPAMRAQRAGRILNLSSVGGFTVGPGWGVYGSTKFAIEGLSEAMHAELAPLGITVTVIEPGLFRTDFLDASSLKRAARVLEDYELTAGEVRDWSHDANHEQPGDPAKAAAAMIIVATAEEPPLRLQLGADCVARVEEKLALVAGELDQWRALSLSTAFADVA